MSEELIQEALGQQADAVEQAVDNTSEEQYVDDIPDLSPTEQKAWDQGWRPQDQFDGNPDNWKSADAYILYGEMQEQIREVKAETRRKEAEFDARIENLNKLHEAQQQATIAELRAKQREAVQEADTEEFDRLQQQIDNQSKVEAVPQAPVKDPAITAWEEKNPWINDVESEKAQQAQAFWAVAASKPGATAQTALAYVDSQMAKLYPEMQTPSNPRREMPTMTEQSRRPAQRGRNKELTMNDLTADERQQWQMFGSSMFKDEKTFLKAVADARKV